EVVEAEDGEVAIKKLRAESFDLLITDYNMPGADGLEVLDEASSLYPKMPVIFMSAVLAPEVQHKVEGLANHIMEKPFSIAELAGVVARLLG
ncbi:MAG TPA: response regulator, partial [Dehalococcoidia bacterium]|nr:response regulator [Dehalococcoidia bacterium]